jgi:hypothetical protein
MMSEKSDSTHVGDRKKSAIEERLCSQTFHKAALVLRATILSGLLGCFALNITLGVGRFWIMVLVMYIFYRMQGTVKVLKYQEALSQTDPENVSEEDLKVVNHLDGDIRLLLLLFLVMSSAIIFVVAELLFAVRKVFGLECN